MMNRKLDQKLVDTVKAILPTALEEKRKNDQSITREQEANLARQNERISIIVGTVPFVVARAIANMESDAVVCENPRSRGWEAAKVHSTKGDSLYQLTANDTVGNALIKQLEGLGFEVQVRCDCDIHRAVIAIKIVVKWTEAF